MNDLRTPISRARGLGSGKTGTEHFWVQRVTAVVLALLVPWLVGLLVSLAGAELGAVQAAIARPWNAILLAAFVVALFWHAKLGIQVVIEDYVHTPRHRDHAAPPQYPGLHPGCTRVAVCDRPHRIDGLSP